MARRVVIGKLAANLSLGNKQFNSGLRESQGKLRTFSRGVKIMGLGVASAGAALAVGAAGLLKWGANQARTLNDTVQFSRRLGIATDKLMGLHAAGKVWNVTASNINLGLQRMTRRIAEAGQGTGEAKNALKELGLPAKQLAQLDPGAQFMRVADAMANVANRGDQVRLAFKLFDSEGVGLINLLDKGAEKLQDILQFSKDVGATITTGGADAISDLAEKLAKAALAWEGIKLQLSQALLPTLKELATDFSEWAQGAGNMQELATSVAQLTKGLAWLMRGTTSYFGSDWFQGKGLAEKIFTMGYQPDSPSQIPVSKLATLGIYRDAHNIELQTAELARFQRMREAGFTVPDEHIRQRLDDIANNTANTAVPAT